jgi:hypothetical protein
MENKDIARTEIHEGVYRPRCICGGIHLNSWSQAFWHTNMDSNADWRSSHGRLAAIKHQGSLHVNQS